MSNHSNLPTSRKCPACSSTDLILLDDIGVLVCGKCGLVIEENVLSCDYERRFFSQSDKLLLRRTTTPCSTPLLSVRQYLVGIKSHHEKNPLESTHEKKLKYCASFLSDYCNKLLLPDSVKHETLRIISQYLAKRNVSMKDLPAFIAAAMFIALRNNGNYKPLNRMLKLLGIPKKSFSKMYRLLKETLNIQVQLPNPEKYVLVFGNELRMSNDCIRVALNIIKRLKTYKETVGKDAASLAAAALYYASLVTGEKRSQKRIAQIAATTETTIRNRFKEICNILSLKI